MTAQLSDQMVLANRTYDICGCEGGELFELAAAGIPVTMESTACWRGYCATYSVRHDHLTLSHLHAHVPAEHIDRIRSEPSATQLQVLPSESSSRFGGFNAVWASIFHPVRFTGGLLLGSDLIRELYVHMGFHPAWKYRTVRELVFDGGRLVSDRDLSEAMKERRSALQREDADNRERAPGAWIEATFSRGYAYAMGERAAAATEDESRIRRAQWRAEQGARRPEELAGIRQRSKPLLATMHEPRDGRVLEGPCPRCTAVTQLRVCFDDLVLCFRCYFDW